VRDRLLRLPQPLHVDLDQPLARRVRVRLRHRVAVQRLLQHLRQIGHLARAQVGFLQLLARLRVRRIQLQDLQEQLDPPLFFLGPAEPLAQLQRAPQHRDLVALVGLVRRRRRVQIAQAQPLLVLDQQRFQLRERRRVGGRQADRLLQVHLRPVRVAERVREERADPRQDVGLERGRQLRQLLVARQPLVRERQLGEPVVPRRRRIQPAPQLRLVLAALRRGHQHIQDLGLVLKLLVERRAQRFEPERHASHLRVGLHGFPRA
jgi:hypothetical protein